MGSPLAGDVLNATLGRPGGAWNEVVVLQVTDSTNALAAADPRPWRLVVAAEQTAGRGRRDRVWASPPDTSVSISMVVPLTAGEPAWLPLVVGLATREALGQVSGQPDRFALKWPNDVLARADDGGWGKICGILCQVVTGPLGAVAVAGVGVNVAVPAADLPVPGATSLHRCGYAPAASAREAVATAIGASVARLCGHWAGGDAHRLRQAYRAACATIGADVQVHLPDSRTVTGRVVDVADSGELLLAGDAGTEAYAAGDVVHMRPARA